MRNILVGTNTERDTGVECEKCAIYGSDADGEVVNKVGARFP